MMVMDFAENYTCQYQGEVQAAHWHHEQAPSTQKLLTTGYVCLFVFLFLLKLRKGVVGKAWNKTTAAEMKLFIFIQFMFGIHKLPEIDNYQ